jgi:hypothetical protein
VTLAGFDSLVCRAEFLSNTLEQRAQRRVRDPAADDVVEQLTGDSARRLVSAVELELAFVVVLAGAKRDGSLESRRRDAARGSPGGPRDAILRGEVSRAGKALGRSGDVPRDLAPNRQRGHQRETTFTLAPSGFEAQPALECSGGLDVRGFDVHAFAR